MKKIALSIVVLLLVGKGALAQMNYEPLASVDKTEKIKTNAYTLHYENGKVEEVGHWRAYRNVGEFKRYYQNGQLAQHFNFTESGKRDGVQRYYFENGNLRAIGKWRNGLPIGEIRIYNEVGQLIETLKYEDGNYDSRLFDLFNY
ncbi:MAG: hypothetical protein RIC95_05050 [Vicingaceae bacterium]